MSNHSDAIRRAIEASVVAGQGQAPSDIAATIVQDLEQMKLISFSGSGRPGLLTVNGRVLMLLMEYPEMSLRELSTRIGSTESSASRSLANLMEAGMVKRKKVRGKNRYEINKDAVLAHPDLRRMYQAMDTFLGPRV